MNQEVRMTVWRGKGKGPSVLPDGVDAVRAEERKAGNYDGPPPPEEKYRGAVATGYDKKREQQPRWHEEQKIIEDLLSYHPAGSKVLDIPIGTGRFIDVYARHHHVLVGIDISFDMLTLAEQKIAGRIDSRLYSGDMRDIDGDFPGKFFDVAVMCRITRWLSIADCQKVLKELGRITAKEIIITARVADHPHARPLRIFAEALPDWYLASVPVPSDKNYHVIRMTPKTPVAAEVAAPPPPPVMGNLAVALDEDED